MREGFEIEELEEWVLNQRLKLVHFFTVDDLNHLKRGGRLSGGAAFIGTVLQLKPLLHVDDLGRLVAYGKVIGRKNALKQMVERMADRMIDPSEQTVFISHGDCLQEAEYVSRLIQDHYHVRSVVIGYVGRSWPQRSGTIASSSWRPSLTLFQTSFQRRDVFLALPEMYYKGQEWGLLYDVYTAINRSNPKMTSYGTCLPTNSRNLCGIWFCRCRNGSWESQPNRVGKNPLDDLYQTHPQRRSHSHAKSSSRSWKIQLNCPYFHLLHSWLYSSGRIYNVCECRPWRRKDAPWFNLRLHGRSC